MTWVTRFYAPRDFSSRQSSFNNSSKKENGTRRTGFSFLTGKRILKSGIILIGLWDSCAYLFYFFHFIFADTPTRLLLVRCLKPPVQTVVSLIAIRLTITFSAFSKTRWKKSTKYRFILCTQRELADVASKKKGGGKGNTAKNVGWWSLYQTVSYIY